MAVVKKTVLVSFSAEQMFALVEKVEDYPLFLPWCGGVSVAERNEKTLKATLSINYHVGPGSAEPKGPNVANAIYRWSEYALQPCGQPLCRSEYCHGH